MTQQKGGTAGRRCSVKTAKGVHSRLLSKTAEGRHISETAKGVHSRGDCSAGRDCTVRKQRGCIAERVFSEMVEGMHSGRSHSRRGGTAGRVLHETAEQARNSSTLEQALGLESRETAQRSESAQSQARLESAQRGNLLHLTLHKITIKQ